MKPRITAEIRALSLRATRGWIVCGQAAWPCALGRSGRSAHKREGDGATPLGRFETAELLYRADRGPRPPGRRVRGIAHDDGWCDALGDRNYNRPVRHPYPASAERLWREDHLYDVVIVVRYNQRPRRQGRGSAIFVHVARPGYEPTEGCVAMAASHLRQLARRISGCGALLSTSVALRRPRSSSR